MGLFPLAEPETVIVFDTPVGLVRTWARVQEGRVQEVALSSMPVFVFHKDTRLSDPELGELPVDIVYSGGFFLLVEAGRVGLELIPENAEALADLGFRLRDCANFLCPISAPTVFKGGSRP